MACWLSTVLVNHQRIPHTLSSNGTWCVIFREASVEIQGLDEKYVGIEITEKPISRTLMSMGIPLFHSAKVQSTQSRAHQQVHGAFGKPSPCLSLPLSFFLMALRWLLPQASGLWLGRKVKCKWVTFQWGMSTKSIKLSQRFLLAMSVWVSLPELHHMSSLDQSAEG